MFNKDRFFQIMIICIAIMFIAFCGSNEDKKPLNVSTTPIIYKYGVVVKDRVNAYSDCDMRNISSTLKLSDIVYIESKEKKCYKLCYSSEYVPDSCIVLIDSILNQIKVGSFVYNDTYHDIFRIKDIEYTPIYLTIYYPFLTHYDYQVKKHFSQDIEYIFGDKIPIDSSLFLKKKNDQNILCLNSTQKEYQFFVIKDSVSGRIGITVFWGINSRTKSFVNGYGSNNFKVIKKAPEKKKSLNSRLIGSWSSGDNIKWNFKEDGVLTSISGNTILDYTWSLNTNYNPYHLDCKIEGEPIVIKAIIRFIDNDKLEWATDRDLNRNRRSNIFDVNSQYLFRYSDSNEEIAVPYVPKDDILKNSLYESYKSSGVLNVEVYDFCVILEVNETLCRGFLLDKISTLTIMENIMNTIKYFNKKNLGIVDVYYRNKKILTAETRILQDGIKIKYFE